MDWFVNEPKSFKNFGNARSPGYASMIQLISDIWKNIYDDLLNNSFDYSGIISQNKLHSILQQNLSANLRLGEIVETDVEADDEPDFRAELNSGTVTLIFKLC